MRSTLLLATIALPIMLALDITWVTVIADKFYRSQLGYLYTPHTVWEAAALFYIIYVLGLIHFVLKPGIAAHSLKKTVLNAAFFGLVAYGTYDLTSLAITSGWPVLMTFVDMAWGVFCASAVSALTYLAAVHIHPWKSSKDIHPMIIQNS